MVVKFARLLTILLGVTFFLFSGVPVHAECDDVTFNAPSPANGGVDTSFTITGTITNCTNRTDPNTSGLEFIAYSNETEGEATENYAFAVRSDGKFTVQNVTFPSAGEWELGINNNRGNVVNGTYLFTVSDGAGTVKTYACGEDGVAANYNACPDPCIPAAFKKHDNTWACYTRQQIDDYNASHLVGSCTTVETVTEVCDAEETLTNATACSVSGQYSCGDGQLLCYVGSKSAANLRCQSNIIKQPTAYPTATPFITPRPPAPPCFGSNTTTEFGDPNDPNDDKLKLINCRSVMTGLGIEIDTGPYSLIGSLFTFFLSISGMILVGIIVYSGYQMMISHGDPKRIQGARERITSAIIGFLFLIFSMVMLEIIGVNVLRIPGFCGQNDPDCQQATFTEPTPIPTINPTNPPSLQE